MDKVSDPERFRHLPKVTPLRAEPGFRSRLILISRGASGQAPGGGGVVLSVHSCSEAGNSELQTQPLAHMRSARALHGHLGGQWSQEAGQAGHLLG